MIEVQENTSNPPGRKEAEEMGGWNSLHEKASLGHVSPETGNLYPLLNPRQLGLNQDFSKENGNLAGQVEEQITHGETNVFLHYTWKHHIQTKDDKYRKPQ